MRIYGMVIVFSITILLLSSIIYFLFANIDVKEIIREPMPVYTINTFHQGIKDSLVNITVNSKNLSTMLFIIEDLGVFIGKIKIDYLNNHITIAVINDEMFQELKTSLKSFDSNIEEFQKNVFYYGLKLKKSIVYSRNFTLINYPTVAIVDLNNLSNEELTFLKLKYYVMDKENYKSYSFKTSILESLKNENGVIIDEKILNYPGIKPLLDVFETLGFSVIYDMKVYTGGLH